MRFFWILLDSRSSGGIESHVGCLAIALAQYNLPVQVVFMRDYGPHPLKDRLDEAGVSWFALSGNPWEMAHRMAHDRPFLVHTHGYKAGIFGRILGKLLGIPTLSTFHAGEPGSGRLRLYTWLDRQTARLGPCLAVSQAIADRLPKKCEVISNFVELPPSDPTRPPKRSVAFVGRFSHEKGPDLFCALAQMHPELDWLAFGDGPMRADLARAYGDHLRFIGAVADMKPFWKDIGLLCMPSRFEGLPMAALEAMAHGVPVAAFHVGALGELISSDANGFLAPAGALDALSAKITHWAALDETAQRALGASAYATIAHRYAPQAVLPKIINAYRQAGAHGSFSILQDQFQSGTHLAP